MGMTANEGAQPIPRSGVGDAARHHGRLRSGQSSSVIATQSISISIGPGKHGTHR